MKIRQTSTLTIWSGYVDNLSWIKSNHDYSIRRAFETALRLGISKSKAFFDVAEQIHRSFRPVNWGVLNYQWEEALADHNLSQSRKCVCHLAPSHEQTKPASLVDYYV
jgi:hypothetical protein